MATATATASRTAAQVEDLLRQGCLDDAVASLTAHLRAHPADAEARASLFALLAVGGAWERAANQLRTCAQLDGEHAVLAAVYLPLLEIEKARAAVAAGDVLPTLAGEPAPWTASLLQAARLDGQGQHAEAAALRALAFEDAPAVSGQIDDTPFAWLADADPRFGPCLELAIEGRHLWVPCTRIGSVSTTAPVSLCDTLWLPTEITWAHGGQSAAFLFARYPGSEVARDSAVRLARRTDWREVAEGSWVGIGQRMLATDAGDHALLDVRSIRFDVIADGD